MEAKHLMQVVSWAEFFEPKHVFDYGCGTGEYVHIWRDLGVVAFGFDISKHAVSNSYGGYCFNEFPAESVRFDLVSCYDVLEHLTEEEVDQALANINQHASKWILFSICMAGDPNFALDKTHVLQRSRSWWKEKLSKYWDVFDAPENFSYSHQLLVCKVRGTK